MKARHSIKLNESESVNTKMQTLRKVIFFKIYKQQLLLGIELFFSLARENIYVCACVKHTTLS